MAVTLTPLQPPPTVPAIGAQSFVSGWLAWFRAIWALLSYMRVGTGDPVGVLTTDGSILLYLRIDGGAGTVLYILEAGAWTAK